MSDTEIAALVAELEQLMAQLRSNVSDLQTILTTVPEVPPSGQPA